MTSSQSFLLHLLSLGLGGNPDGSVDCSGVDLHELSKIASLHGVSAVALDGLQKAYDDDPETRALLDKPENKKARLEWLSGALSQEARYDSQLKAASELSSLWAANGIRPVVMKGLAYGRFYPVPQHRYSSDLDCYLFDKWEDGNALVEKRGVKISRSFYKNSSFTFDGLFVENHRFCSPVRGEKKKKEYERFLQNLLTEGPLTPLEGTAFLCPPPMFEAIFYMSHALNHFLGEGGVTLRHVCDWGMLMKAYSSVLDWKAFLENCDRYGLRRFADAMSQVAKRVCGVEIPFESIGRDAAVASAALLEEILNPTCGNVEFGHGWRTRKQLITARLKSGWKYRMFSDRSMFGTLLRSVWAFFFEREPEVGVEN